MPDKPLIPASIPKGVPVRGILGKMLVLDCVKIGPHEAVVVLPKGIEVVFILPMNGYSEATKDDEAEAITYINLIHKDNTPPTIPPEVYPEP